MSLVDELSNLINNALRTYEEEIREDVSRIGEDLAEECAEKLKIKSPKRYGDYARSWEFKKLPTSRGEPRRYKVYNKKHYRLTHLLEYGHANHLGGGRTPAYPHIKQIELEINDKFEEKVKEALRR